MKLEKKIKILIFFCIIVLAGLVFIQYQLIKDTYISERKILIYETKDSVWAILHNPGFNSIDSFHIAFMKELSIKKARDSITKDELLKITRKKVDSMRETIGNKILAGQLKKHPILNDLKIHYQISKAYIKYGDMPADTILGYDDEPLYTYGNFPDYKNGLYYGKSGNYVFGLQEFDANNNLVRDKFRYEEEYRIYYNISHWQKQILSEMAWMLIAAATLLCSVMFLFYKIFRSLLRQKKIAEAKSDFANNITHELKTPLTTLNLIVSSLQKEITEENRQPNIGLVDSLARQNNRIRNIVDRILETSMLHHTTYLQNVDVVKFLNEFISDYKSETHDLKTEINPDKLFIQTDTYQLGRVLQNLIDNAQKYSPGKKEIILRSYIKNDFFTIEVQDFGMGIPRKQHKKIFEKFYRVSQGNMHDVKGLGLGLYLCKEIMKELGGTISIKKNSEKSTIFKIRLPT